MNRIHRGIAIAAGLYVAMLPLARHAHAQEVVRASQAPGEQQLPINKEELDAVETARQAVARALYVPADTLPVLSIEKRTWPNSGLGCASPDTATINISRHGYALALATPDGVRHVNVAGRQSRICNLPSTALDASGMPEALDAQQPTYDLNAVVQRSREDLARRLKTSVNSVRLVSFVSATWPDNTMDCAVPYERSRKKRVEGYRIQLRKGDSVYVYHTDLVRARACPAVETQTAAANPKSSVVPTKASTKRTKKKTTADASSQTFLGIVQRYPSP